MLTGWTDFDRTFGSLDELRRRMEQLFEGVGLDAYRSLSVWPPANLTDSGSKLILQAQVPGCSERDVEISVTQDGLSLSGTRKAEPPQGYSVLRRERPSLNFSRSFELPCKIEPSRVEATVKDGILTIVLPKAEEAQPKQIEIKATTH